MGKWIIGFILLLRFNSMAHQGFGANDVSFLFPLQDGRPYPIVQISKNPEILSQDLLRQVLQFEYSTELDSLPYLNGKFLIDLKQWYVTSFRFEDCGHEFVEKDETTPALALDQTGACQAHLRLVLQPFNLSDQPLATALHLIYMIPPEKNSLLIDDLIKIKNLSSEALLTSVMPLMVHPGLMDEATKESSQQRIGPQIQKFLQEHIALSQLKLITMTLNIAVMNWKMVGGTVQSGQWKRFVTPFSKSLYALDDASVGIEQIVCNPYHYCYTLPNEESTASAGLLTSYFKRKADGAPPKPVKNQDTEILAEVIDHPSQTHFFNTNCMSCHESSHFRNRSVIHTDLELISGITPFTLKKHMSDKASNIINFGYEGLTAQVSTRTASESAVVARGLNQKLSLENPGYTPKNTNEFWQCLMTQNDFLSCFNFNQ